jgi:hypothetical protein
LGHHDLFDGLLINQSDFPFKIFLVIILVMYFGAVYDVTGLKIIINNKLDDIVNKLKI